MPELLIIKAGNQYFRFKDQQYYACELNKASVFAVDKIETVRKLINRLQGDGIHQPYIAKLTITEKPYTEE